MFLGFNSFLRFRSTLRFALFAIVILQSQSLNAGDQEDLDALIDQQREIESNGGTVSQESIERRRLLESRVRPPGGGTGGGGNTRRVRAPTAPTNPALTELEQQRIARSAALARARQQIADRNTAVEREQHALRMLEARGGATEAEKKAQRQRLARVQNGFAADLTESGGQTLLTPPPAGSGSDYVPPTMDALRQVQTDADAAERTARPEEQRLLQIQRDALSGGISGLEADAARAADAVTAATVAQDPEALTAAQEQRREADRALAEQRGALERTDQRLGTLNQGDADAEAQRQAALAEERANLRAERRAEVDQAQRDQAALAEAESAAEERGDQCVAAGTKGFGGSASCRADSQASQSAATLNNVIEQGGSALAGIVGQGMQQQAASAGGDQKKILENSAKQKELVGASTLTMAAAQSVVALYGSGYLTNSHRGSLEAVNEGLANIDQAKIDCDKGATVSLNPTQTFDCSNAENRTKMKTEMEKLRGTLLTASGDHEATDSTQLSTMLTGLVSSAKNMASGGMMIASGQADKKAADRLGAPEINSPGPQGLIAPENQFAGGQTPAPVINQAPLESESAATAAETETDEALAPDNPIGPPSSPGATPGGLAGKPPEATKDFRGNAQSTAAGGGGAGGGSGGGAGAPDDPKAPGAAEQFAGGARVGFGDASQGAGFAAVGGGAKRESGTGGIDLQGLLGQLLPGGKEKDDDRKPSSILEYSKKTIGPGNRDDGSILGKNANLFGRISTAHTTNYQKGNLLR